MQYDYVIVGAGPAGLTLATQLAPLGFKIAVIEAAGSVGGCHRARRDAAGYFGEHGPRVYSGCYLAVKDVLRTLGTTWDRMFVPAPEFRSEEHTSELQSRFGISYAVFCLKKKKKKTVLATRNSTPERYTYPSKDIKGRLDG